MREGMKIVVHSQYGELKIEAGKEGERSFEWDSQTYTVKLIPRIERWGGKLGLYHPQLRPPHKNVVHMVAEEYENHFRSIEDAIQYLNQHESKESIYNDNGLLVRFEKQTNSSGQIAINIKIVQILIHGKKPFKLPGSQNNKIEIKKTSN